MEKYEFTGATKVEVYNGKEFVMKQIRALRDIKKHGIKAGTLGGWLSECSQLSDYGDAWVSGHSHIYGSLITKDVYIYQSNVYNSNVDGSGKIQMSAIFSSSFSATTFKEVDNCVLSHMKSMLSTLDLTNSSVNNISVQESELYFRESQIESLGDAPFVIMTEQKRFTVKSSHLFIKTDHLDHARIHGRTSILDVQMHQSSPLTMLTAFEDFLWSHLLLGDMQFHYGHLYPSDEKGHSILSGTEEERLVLVGGYLQSQDSLISGEVKIKGDILMEKTKIVNMASVVNTGKEAISLHKVKLSDMASIEKKVDRVIELKERSYGADNLIVFD